MKKETIQKSGYTAGNVLNLFIETGQKIDNLNFSELSIWEADLQEKNLRNVPSRCVTKLHETNAIQYSTILRCLYKL